MSILLIFGTSHVGKSTLARRLGRSLGLSVVSTDAMVRHPGRPWPEVRPPVAEYYSSLSDETIYWFLRVCHENTWPLVRKEIAARSGGGESLIFEGSALRPEFIGGLEEGGVTAVGLHAAPAFLRARMESESRRARNDEGRQLLIDKFIARSLRDNEQIVAEAHRLGLRLVDVADAGRLDDLAAELTITLAR